jgi:hypothetical protein
VDLSDRGCVRLWALQPALEKRWGQNLLASHCQSKQFHGSTKPYMKGKIRQDSLRLNIKVAVPSRVQSQAKKIHRSIH